MTWSSFTSTDGWIQCSARWFALSDHYPDICRVSFFIQALWEVALPDVLDPEARRIDPFACISDREIAGINDLSPENARG